MRDALVLVDVIGTFRHEDGERLAAAFVESAPALRAELDDARSRAAGVEPPARRPREGHATRRPAGL